jgi:hypothetical protein
MKKSELMTDITVKTLKNGNDDGDETVTEDR